MQAQEAWRYRNSEDQSCDVSRLSVGVTTLKGADILALLRGANDALLLKGADVLALLRGTDVLALLRGINRMLYSGIGNHVHALSKIECDFCKSV
jgi:hypothetical protein